MAMRHHINMPGQNIILNALDIKKSAEDIVKHSILLKDSAQFIIIKHHHIKKS